MIQLMNKKLCAPWFVTETPGLYYASQISQFGFDLLSKT